MSVRTALYGLVLDGRRRPHRCTEGRDPEEDGQGQKVLIIKLHPEDFN